MHAFNVYILIQTVILTCVYNKKYARKDLLCQDEEEIEMDKLWLI
jgi:hypothetical protein